MGTDSYFTLEQLERRVRDARSNIQYGRRKILIELITSSVVLFYVSSGLEVRIVGWLTVPFVVNIIAWLFWIWDVGRRALRGSYVPPHDEMDLVDEYRRLSYQLAHLTFREAIFDT